MRTQEGTGVSLKLGDAENRPLLDKRKFRAKFIRCCHRDDGMRALAAPSRLSTLIFWARAFLKAESRLVRAPSHSLQAGQGPSSPNPTLTTSGTVPMPISRKKSVSAMAWPPNMIREGETEEEKKTRLRDEAEAKRVSDMIDHQLESERLQKNKNAGGKILLLGQAESGKSTVLKNFQLHFAPKAFELEAEVWRPVIHLNLVRSVNFIVNLVLSQSQSQLRRSDSISSRNSRKSSSSLNPELRRLTIRLAPLRQVEENLIQNLSGRVASQSVENSAPSGTVKVMHPYIPAKSSDISAPPTKWKQALSLQRKQSMESISTTNSTMSADRIEGGQSRRILAALGSDIAALWADPAVQQILKASEIALQEQPGFFLDQVKRVTHEDYRPLPDDVLKARVTTVGPEEHTIIAESGSEKARHWTIYDVGGSRNQRAAWAQFFDDVNIIIFLAPMSGFNQVLAEDESVNRLSDSLRLWQTICSNKILAGVEFVLFLNKLDILDTKLRSGIQFSSFVTSYADKPNETKSVSRYLLDVFISIHQQYSPQRRKLHPHLTCAVDTKATAKVINRIQEVILVKILSSINLV